MIDSGRIEGAKGLLGAATSSAQDAVTVLSGGPEAVMAAFPMFAGAFNQLGSAITMVCDVLSQVVGELNKLTDRPGGPDPNEAKFSGIDSAIAELKAEFAKLAPQPDEGPDMHQVRVDNVESEIDELKSEMAKFDHLREDVEQALTTVHSDMKALQNQFRADIESLRSQVSAG